MLFNREEGLKHISERRNLSVLTSAEGGVFSGRTDNTVKPLNSFVWLASIQACEPCPTQSAAIVAVRMLQQLCVRLHCYTAVLSLHLLFSVQPTLFHFFFLCRDPVILSQRYDSLLYPSTSFISPFSALLLLPHK